LAAQAQLRNGGNSNVDNAFQGDVGFDYMGLSMDFLGGKTNGAISSGPLTQAQLATAVTTVSSGYGFLSITPSDNTYFQIGARYTIGPWKFFGGYEHINYASPGNPLAPGAFMQGGMIAAVVNNTNFLNDKILQTAWVGVRYAITPALDITGAYYHEWQNNFSQTVGEINGCAVLGASSFRCAGTLNAVSVAMDWRFARHMDMYAGMMWSQVNGGLASGFLMANGLPNGTINTLSTRNSASNFDPGIGLRYQF
jgi:predicted porin